MEILVFLGVVIFVLSFASRRGCLMIEGEIREIYVWVKSIVFRIEVIGRENLSLGGSFNSLTIRSLFEANLLMNIFRVLRRIVTWSSYQFKLLAEEFALEVCFGWDEVTPLPDRQILLLLLPWGPGLVCVVVCRFGQIDLEPSWGFQSIPGLLLIVSACVFDSSVAPRPYWRAKLDCILLVGVAADVVWYLGLAEPLQFLDDFFFFV